MKRYHSFQLVMFFLLALYFIVGSVSWFVFRVEYYPIFSWDLFSRVPNTVTDYGLLITAVDQAPLDQQLYFEEASMLFADTNSIIASNMIQGIGYNTTVGNKADAEALRIQFESLYFEAYQSVTYEIVQRTYTPIERYQNSLFISEESLQTAEYRGDS